MRTKLSADMIHGGFQLFLFFFLRHRGGGKQIFLFVGRILGGGVNGGNGEGANGGGGSHGVPRGSLRG